MSSSKIQVYQKLKSVYAGYGITGIVENLTLGALTATPSLQMLGRGISKTPSVFRTYSRLQPKKFQYPAPVIPLGSRRGAAI